MFIRPPGTVVPGATHRVDKFGEVIPTDPKVAAKDQWDQHL